jgi:hypothetical protein
MKNKLELGVSCLAGFGLGIVFILLSLSTFSLVLTCIFLLLLGICGGVFVIPFDTFNQMNSPIEKRGQVMAAANFLSFAGVLIASVALYVFNDLLKMSPALSFFLIGLFTIFVSFLMTLRLSGTSLHFLAKNIILPLCKSNIKSLDVVNKPGLFLLEEATILKTLIFIGIAPDVHLLLPKRKNRPFWYSWIHSMDEIENLDTQAQIIEHAKKSLGSYLRVCLLLKEKITVSSPKKPSFKSLFLRERIYAVKIDKDEHKNFSISITEL